MHAFSVLEVSAIISGLHNFSSFFVGPGKSSTMEPTLSLTMFFRTQNFENLKCLLIFKLDIDYSFSFLRNSYYEDFTSEHSSFDFL